MGFLTTVHILLYVFGETDRHGFAIWRAGIDFKTLQWFNVVVVQLPLNILAQLIVFGSGYVRRCLLAPPKDPIWNPDGRLYYQSLTAWQKTTLTRKLLWLVLSITSLPIHFFYNSILITSIPAYDAYEVLVDERFFQGQPANVSALNVTEFRFQPGAPVPYSTPWPGQWPASSYLQRSLESVQRNPSSWTNLSSYECRSKYGLDIYQDFRTVILVTNWTSSPPSSNSALAIGALPGFPPNGVPSRFVALCPQSYLSVTPNMTLTTTHEYPQFINTDDVTQCRASMGATCSEWAWNGHSSGSLSSKQAREAAHDLCHLYHRYEVDLDPSLRVPLTYCLSEPLSNATGQLVWSKLITVIAAGALTLKFVAITLTLHCLRSDKPHGFPTGFPWPQLGKHMPLSGFVYVILSIGFIAFFYTTVLGLNNPPFSLGSAPSHDKDWRFILGILSFQNGIHAAMVVREFIEANYFEQSEGLSRGKPRQWIPFSSVLFAWNLGLHQIVSAWLAIAMVDRYPLGTLEDKEAPSVRTMILDSVLSGHTGTAIEPFKFTGGGLKLVIALFWPLLHMLMFLVLHALFRRKGIPQPASADASPRISFSDFETFTDIEAIPLHDLHADGAAAETTAPYTSIQHSAQHFIHDLRIGTPSDSLLCGLFALQLSMQAQHPDINAPTIADPQAQFQHPGYLERSRAAGYMNTNHLQCSQLVARLYFWGRERGLNLQVVAYRPRRGSLLEPIATARGDGVREVWIFNDDAEEMNVGEEAVAHWEGLVQPVYIGYYDADDLDVELENIERLQEPQDARLDEV